MKLYELTEIYNNVLSLEDTEINQVLASIEEEIEKKAENLAKLVRQLEAENEGIKAEEKRLANLRKAQENKIKSLKKYLEQQMIAMDRKKFKTSLFSFNIQKNPASVRILKEDKIPEEFFRIKKEPIRADIKAALERGELKGVAEIVQTESLRIR